MIKKKWEHFSHEADIGIRGIGSTLIEAFEMAALALTNVIVDSDTVKASRRLTISCDAPNIEILFIDWLNSIIYNMSVNNMLFCKFHVCLNQLKLTAVIEGEMIDQHRHKPVVEVKGATYTALTVEEKKGIWIAQCVVDV